MPTDPSQHAESRNWLESIANWIPGFHGYLQKEYRRESDALARGWIADRLQECKLAIDNFGRKLVERGEIDDLPACERFRNRIDGMINKLRSDVRGYSGMFDYVKVGEAELEAVYALEMELMREVEVFTATMKELPASTVPPSEAIPPLFAQFEVIEQKYKRRGELLEGLKETT
jgi:hypothetical protein